MKRVAGIGLILLVLLSGIFVYQYARFYDGKFHIVFCDVGQGDAIFVRTPSGMDVLVDGGPNDSVLSCLVDHMPFWDRDLELVILTHPHADHLNGLTSVAQRYKITTFATEKLKNKSSGFARLMDTLKDQKVKIIYVYQGDQFALKDGVSIDIVGPTKEFLRSTSPQGFIGESREFGSVLSLVRHKEFSILLTGDSQASELNEALRLSFDSLRIAQGKISILQIPHHGSKTGLTVDILDSMNPKLAVISVGKNNYGHPASQIIKILRDKDIEILRTDKDGEIEIVSDGESWGVKNRAEN